MSSKKNKFCLEILAAIIISLFFTFSVFGKEFKDEFSEIKLLEADQPEFFLNAIKNENIHLEKNYYDKDRFKYNINNESNFKGLIELDLKEDKNTFLYENTEQKFDTKVDFFENLNPFMDLNTEISLYELNNRSNGPMEISNFNVSTNILPYHKLYFGQTSLNDGSCSPLAIFDMMEEQYKLGNFESVEDIDLKISKNRGILNYSAGAYNLNKTGSEKDLIRQTSVAGGHASINPFYKLKGLEDVQIGGGYFTNQHSVKNESDKENAYSVFTEYKFNRFSVRGEFLRKRSGLYNEQISDSWHFSNKFVLTDTLNFKTEFKRFEETDSLESNVIFEYSFKEVPIVENENFKLEFDASFRRSKEWGSNDRERFGIKTKYQF